MPSPNPAELIDLAINLTKTTDESEMFDHVSEYVYGLVDADRVSIALLVEAHNGLDIVALRGAKGALLTGETLPLEGTLVGAAVKTGQTSRWTLEERDEIDATSLRELGLAFVINAPLISGDRRFGSLNAGYRDGSQPSNGDVESLTKLAALLASQLERADVVRQLEHEIQRRRDHTEQLARLHEIESALSAATTFDDVIEAMSDKITEILPVDRVSYAGVERGEGVARLHNIVGVTDVGSSEFFPIDEDKFELLYRKGTCYYTPDHSVSTSEMHQRLARAGIMSSLNLGVYRDDEPVGTLNVGSRDVDGFNSHSRALLNTLASFMGNTIERVEALDRLSYQAHHDHLTGLIRREVFDDRLKSEIERLRDGDRCSAVCFLDIDRFKHVNDTDGHHAGDGLLQQFVNRVSELLDADDLMARIGGDEFVLLLTGRDTARYERGVQRIVEAVSATPFNLPARSVRATVSVGYIVIDSHSPEPKEVLAAADAACYAAKAHGGDRVEMASVADETQSDRISDAHRLRHTESALARGDLVLFGQPIWHLGRRVVSAYEVLVRLRDPDGSMVLPGHFIPPAERHGLISEIDAQVTATALAYAAEAGKKGPAPRLFINLSPISINKRGFCKRIMGHISDSGVAPSSVCFEITETGTMQDFEAVLAFVEDLKQFGIGFALDDFGVGMSSLSHLQTLPVDYLKIDGSLVRNIEHNPRDAAMVASIRAMARALDIESIAEHPETAGAVDMLVEAGLDYAQGFFLGHPVPLERALDIAPPERHATPVSDQSFT